MIGRRLPEAARGMAHSPSTRVRPVIKTPWCRPETPTLVWDEQLETSQCGGVSCFLKPLNFWPIVANCLAIGKGSGKGRDEHHQWDKMAMIGDSIY
jgi:hypothetical protein